MIYIFISLKCWRILFFNEEFKVVYHQFLVLLSFIKESDFILLILWFHGFSLKKSIEVHFEDISIVFLRRLDVNLWEKDFDRSTAYSCRTDVFIGLHHFMKKGINVAED